MPDWKTNREAQDATAEWAIKHLRGVAKEERLDVLRMLIINYKLEMTAEELNRWCRRFEHPDIASGLAVKNVEGQAAVIEHRAVTEAAEAGDEGEPGPVVPEAVASQHRAEGFRAFAELIAPQAHQAIRAYYPKDVRRGSGYARDKDGKRLNRMRYQRVGQGVTWQCVEGAGTIALETGEQVSYVTSCTFGVKDGAVVWALPEVGPRRIWERHRQRKGRPFLELAYHRKVITTGGIDPRVVGIRALGLARRHAPGSMDHAEGAELAKALGLKSRQLMHYHEGEVGKGVERLSSNQKRTV